MTATKPTDDQTSHANLVGRTVQIKSGIHKGQWGIIASFDGDYFAVSGGSFGSDTSPLFERDEFTLQRELYERLVNDRIRQ